MPTRLRISTAGVRLHQFVTGAMPAVGYLAGWTPPVYAALGLSLMALMSERLAIVARLLGNREHAYRMEDPGPRAGLFRLDEAMRVLLMGIGLALLLTGRPIGWLPILAAASTSILEGTTAFSFNLLVYTGLRLVMKHVFRRDGPPADEANPGNPNCVVCTTLQTAPYGRCRWCRLSGIRWCCGLQTSLLLVLLLVIAFLLNAALEPLVTKVLVTMSILGLVALSLAVSHQTNDMIGTLSSLDAAHRHSQRRVTFLNQLALADSVAGAAETAVAYAADILEAGRLSVMVVEEGALRIAASRGIPAHVAESVSVPVPDRICGRVFASGAPVVMDNAGAQGVLQTLGLATPGAAASFPLVAAAMKTAVRKVGVINVTDRRGGVFTPDDLAELQFIAEATAISLSSQMDRRDLETANYAAIRSLALAIEAKDSCTHGHSLRVQVWATAVARELGLTGQRLQALTYAAELHDIGKIAVPDDVLRAARRLTPEEWAIVQEHPRRGVEMVRHMAFLRPAYAAMLHHHERLDGKGYPDGLSGDAVPLEARILAVVDSYDAMTSERPYRPPLTHEEAAEELRRCIGTQFDDRCVQAFLKLVRDHRVDTLAEEAMAAQAN